MLTLARSLLLRGLFSGLLLMRLAPAGAQSIPPATMPAHGYDFMTVTVEAKVMVLIPAFQGTESLALKLTNGLANVAKQADYRANVELINKKLGDITAAGWELVQVMPAGNYALTTSSYLFRKARP